MRCLKNHKKIILLTILGPLIIGFYLTSSSETDLYNAVYHYYYVMFSSLIALVVMYFSFVEYKKNNLPRLFLVAMGFLGVTIFYGIHALITPGQSVIVFDNVIDQINAFVFFGDMSRLWFAYMLYSPKLLIRLVERKYGNVKTLIVTGVICVLISYIALMNPEFIPRLKDASGMDTQLSVLMKVASLVLLGISLIRYSDSYSIKANFQVLTLIVGIILIVETVIVFMITTPWSRLWWMAHNLFLFSYMAIGLGVYVSYYNNQTFEYFDVNTSMKNIIDELTHANTKLETLANTDLLTNLSSRGYFIKYLEQHIILSAGESSFGVIFVDLDGFKMVNDQFGHDVGDEVLISAGDRLKRAVKEKDIVSRFGGDEFIILCKNIRHEALEGVAKRILEAFNTPIIIDGKTCNVGASIGIAMYPDHGDSVESLLLNSDKAMYHVKNNFKNNFAFYESTMNGIRRNR